MNAAKKKRKMKNGSANESRQSSIYAADMTVFSIVYSIIHLLLTDTTNCMRYNLLLGNGAERKEQCEKRNTNLDFRPRKGMCELCSGRPGMYRRSWTPGIADFTYCRSTNMMIRANSCIGTYHSHGFSLNIQSRMNSRVYNYA